MDEELNGHTHRWLRFLDPDTGAANHWCIDGDTPHHIEPCEEHDEDAVAAMEILRQP